MTLHLSTLVVLTTVRWWTQVASWNRQCVHGEHCEGSLVGAASLSASCKQVGQRQLVAEQRGRTAGKFMHQQWSRPAAMSQTNVVRQRGHSLLEEVVAAWRLSFGVMGPMIQSAPNIVPLTVL
ncbi:MAG: hypothetical protein NTZ32_16365 [Planctomycetales bacterium]|nr:hypothetical protein [Planctomycetales bacterium]